MANNIEEIKDEKGLLEKVNDEKTAALNEIGNTYGNMINQSDKYYQTQIDNAQKWADEKTKLQNEQTDFAIQKIEQQKDQSKKDYQKEQSGAYVDWQKQSNEYGANAEKEAAMGMANTGFSESSQVSMYNAYQNRVATARASFDLATQNYNNQITEAKLQNNSILAEIAYQAYTKQAELALQGFQHKNTLLLEQAKRKLEVDELYYQRWKDILALLSEGYNGGGYFGEITKEQKKTPVLSEKNTHNSSISSLNTGKSTSSGFEKYVTSLLIDKDTVTNFY